MDPAAGSSSSSSSDTENDDDEEPGVVVPVALPVAPAAAAVDPLYPHGQQLVIEEQLITVDLCKTWIFHLP